MNMIGEMEVKIVVMVVKVDLYLYFVAEIFAWS